MTQPNKSDRAYWFTAQLAALASGLAAKIGHRPFPDETAQRTQVAEWITTLATKLEKVLDASDDYESERMAYALEDYFETRYEGHNLTQIARSSIVPSEDAYMARALLSWREAEGWPEPGKTGARRCVGCHRVMGDDESSVDQEEEVCETCGSAE